MLEVRLAVIAMNRGKPEASQYLVVPTFELPFAQYAEGDIAQEVAENLFKELLGFAPAPWLICEQVGFFDREFAKKQIILYRAIMPETAPLVRDGRWVSFDELAGEQGEALGMFSLAIGYIRK